MPVADGSDQEEQEGDSHSAAWIAGQPSDIPLSIAENPPTYSGKLNADCSACDAFSLYFDEEVWQMIVEKTNLYALQEMMPNWQTLMREYKPSSVVAIDESMILFKGRSAMKQYMPLKPKIKRGYKVWSIADSDTEYLCKFDFYQGRTDRRPSDMGLGEHVALSLAEGLSPDLQSMVQVRRVMRPTDVPDEGLMCDLLWSDPHKDIMGWGESGRGVSFTFGSDVVAKFVHKFDLDLICRAHQVVEDGYEFFCQETTGYNFIGAQLYCGMFDNAAAMMSVDETLMCSFQVRLSPPLSPN
ncbi:hypothetical protein MRX96_038459 [Rhipicephalus microplus]